eukprot:TRINITY_DN903_c0_g3_i2.p1 TRINITY_DN903_c0_g3~~TRINITY_DN903_c0_g3_i2.p1  ORF type:complete len:302 (-),score=136.68 TRINITY_DN903_c0_g3_i2:11-916(-)
MQPMRSNNNNNFNNNNFNNNNNNNNRNNQGGRGRGNSTQNSTGGAGFLTPSSQSNLTDSPAQKARSVTQQSLTPVTIKQILNCDKVDSSFTIDTKPVQQVTFIAYVLKIKKFATCIRFSIEDGTGQIEAQYWTNSDANSDDGSTNNLAESTESWREFCYIRFIGNIRNFQNNISIVAHKVIPIVDFNEITFHLLETFYVHLRNLSSEQQQQQQNIQIQQHNQNQQQTIDEEVDGQNQMRDMILLVIDNGDSEIGASFDDILQELSNYNYNSEQIRETLNTLINEAVIFNSTDENHFRRTEQ